MENKAYKIVKELDEKLNISSYSEEEYIDIVLKIGKENNLPKKDISKYLTNHIIENIPVFTGNEKEIYKIINDIIEE